ncbi:PDLI2 protein, partial [Galbula dea]|nr:PDLI2 protein [Galbula dea]
MPVTVTLSGPAPWGFRITGGRDFGKPITVSKVTEHGKAFSGDLRPGDIIVTINGESTAEMLNVEAQNKIKRSPGQLQLQVERGKAEHPSLQGPGLGQRAQARSPQSAQEEEGESTNTHTPPKAWDMLGGSCYSPPVPPPRALSTFSLYQERRSLSHQSSSLGSILLPPPRPPSPGLGTPPDPWEMCREQHHSSPSPSSCNSLSSEPAMRRLEEDSEVYKMLQENRELRVAPRQSSTFRLLQEALEDEDGASPTAPFPSRLSPSTRKPVAGVQKLHVCEKCGSSIATQAVRIQESRYRHPSCYACADCGLNLKMRGHFWAGDELYCEKHARLRYQGPPGGSPNLPGSPHS